MKQSFFPQAGEFFVELGRPYDEVKIIQAVKAKNGESGFFGVYLDELVLGKERGLIRRPFSDFLPPYFPVFSKFRAPRKENEHLYHFFKAVAQITEDLLVSKPKYMAKIQEVEERIISNGYSTEQAQTVIKVLLADLMLYKYGRNGKDELISFSEHKTRYHNILQYYGSIAEELRIKSNRISLLVSHGQTVGNYREVILRDLIKQHLPTKFSIATGFIEGFAQQLDIIIYDSHNYSPFFKEGDLVVVKQEAVRAIIEVKTTLTPSTLLDALVMFHHISLPGYRKTYLPIFKGIYSFDSSYTKTSSIAKYVYDFYNKPYFNEQAQKKMIRYVLYLYHEISCVTTLHKHCVLSRYVPANKDKSGNLVPTLFSISDNRDVDIQTASFLSLLFDYLDVDIHAKRSSVWNFSNVMSSSSDIKLEKKLTEDDWLPSFRSDNEHDGTPESVKRRLQTISAWFNGKMNTTDFIADNEVPTIPPVPQ